MVRGRIWNLKNWVIFSIYWIFNFCYSFMKAKGSFKNYVTPDMYTCLCVSGGESKLMFKKYALCNFWIRPNVLEVGIYDYQNVYYYNETSFLQGKVQKQNTIKIRWCLMMTTLVLNSFTNWIQIFVVLKRMKEVNNYERDRFYNLQNLLNTQELHRKKVLKGYNSS